MSEDRASCQARKGTPLGVLGAALRGAGVTAVVPDTCDPQALAGCLSMPAGSLSPGLGFVVWLTGIVVSSLAYRKAKRLAGRARYVAAGLFAAVAVAAIWWSINITADTGARAAFVPIDPPNSPIGVGKGIYPGRVVWVHDPSATKWDGVTGYWWDEQNLDQQAVDNMVSRALRTLTGAAG